MKIQLLKPKELEVKLNLFVIVIRITWEPHPARHRRRLHVKQKSISQESEIIRLSQRQGTSMLEKTYMKHVRWTDLDSKY